MSDLDAVSRAVLERVSRKDSLRRVFDDIKRHAVDVMNKSETGYYVFYSYKMLAAIEGGDPEEWKHDGRLRSLISGHEFRLAFANEYQLWWKADEETHEGLMFTCNPLLGYMWSNRYKHKIIVSACDYMEQMSCVCAKVNPSLGQYFLGNGEQWGKIGTRARKTIGPTLLRLTNGNNPEPAA